MFLKCFYYFGFFSWECLVAWVVGVVVSFVASLAHMSSKWDLSFVGWLDLFGFDWISRMGEGGISLGRSAKHLKSCFQGERVKLGSSG